jgi:hypothetical protein
MEKDLILKEASHLPATIDELREFILIGKAKLKVYEAKVKLIKDLNLAKSVKDQALEDGQDVGEAILWAEAKLGELLKKISGKHPLPSKEEGGRFKKVLPKGISYKQSERAQRLSEHPEVIKEVVKEAKKNEDLPTRTAVFSKIREKQEKERAEKAPPKTQIELSADEAIYQSKLLQIISILPTEPPRQLTEQGFTILSALAKTIIKRLRRFEDGTA